MVYYLVITLLFFLRFIDDELRVGNVVCLRRLLRTAILALQHGTLWSMSERIWADCLKKARYVDS